VRINRRSSIVYFILLVMVSFFRLGLAENKDFRLITEDGPQFKPELLDFGSDGLKGLTEEQKRKLLSGEVVVLSSPEVIGKDKTLITAVLEFNCPINKVWSVLSMPERQNEYLKEIEKINILEQKADFNRLEFVVNLLGSHLRYVVIHHFQPEKYFLWWELDRSVHNDLKELFGFWKLYSAGDKTVGRYGSYVRPDFALPGFLRSMVLRSNIKLTLEKVRNFIESGENEKR